MRKYKLPRVEPFYGRCESWHGTIRTMDDSNTSNFDEDSLDRVIWSWSTHDDWDGECACVCRLKDGRFLSWETSWGPTGDGFYEDAYGGDADVLISSTLEAALKYGISEKIRPNIKEFLED